MRILMLFLDGVGIGARDPRVNPFFAARLPALEGILQGHLPSLHRQTASGTHFTLLPLDATLGVPGLPQSGTGQTALFTGENGSRLIGKHFGPYPFSTLRPVIERRNIFRRFNEAGLKGLFANAFPQRFFDYMARHPSRLTVTTLSCQYASIPLLREADLRAGKALSADITGEGWTSLGYPDMPVITAEEAGRRLAHLSRENDFVLFEYWRTDHAGHAQSMSEATIVLERFDGMLQGVLDHLDLRSSLLVVVSDHGNVEDLSTKTHTRNPVPIILYGHRHTDVARTIRDLGGTKPTLCHLTPALMECMRGHGGQKRSA